MLINDLYTIVRLGSEKPLFLWLEKFHELVPGIINQLEKIVLELTDETDIKNNINILIGLLKENEPNELELAQAFSHIADLFHENIPIEYQDLINDYICSVMKFISLAQASEFSNQARHKLLNTLSKDDQQKYDKKLFAHEGMLYCLEYYLAIYKAIQESSTETEARKYLENVEINLGFGNIPGLWIDFSRDEVLKKFIYAILNDDLRRRLTTAYFNTKLAIMKIRMNCDEKSNCKKDYQDVSLEEINRAFKKLILELLETFSLIGIDRLASFFFKPYGNKPLISEVINQI